MSSEPLSDQEVLVALRNAAVADDGVTMIRSKRLLWLLDRIDRLEGECNEMLPKLLDPDATCCADASRIHKEQRIKIAQLTAMLPTRSERIALRGTTVHCQDEATLVVATTCIDRLVSRHSLYDEGHRDGLASREPPKDPQ